jgi:hypothetical protein
MRTENDVYNTSNYGYEFTYTSDSLWRRVVDPSLPGGEALLLWEYMNGEATRQVGGFGGYMRFLYNFQIYLPFDETRSFRVGATWLEAGGGLLGINVTANSGMIGNGLRQMYIDLEAYLAANPAS